jgi:hypothetical protein
MSGGLDRDQRVTPSKSVFPLPSKLDFLGRLELSSKALTSHHGLRRRFGKVSLAAWWPGSRPRSCSGRPTGGGSALEGSAHGGDDGVAKVALAAGKLRGRLGAGLRCGSRSEALRMRG